MLALNADGSMTNLTTGHTTAAPETEVIIAIKNITLNRAKLTESASDSDSDMIEVD